MEDEPNRIAIVLDAAACNGALVADGGEAV
jgi:hypothetical protein